MSSSHLPNKARLRPDEVAEWFGRSERTIYDWIKQGILPCVKDPTGHIRILREDIEPYNKRSSELEILSSSE